MQGTKVNYIRDSAGNVYNVSQNDLIAIVQESDIATQDLKTGQYIIWNNNPYRVNSDIASGSTITSGKLQALPEGIVNDANKRASENWTLVALQSGVSTEKTQNTLLFGRKFTDFYILFFLISQNDTIRATQIVPMNMFRGSDSWDGQTVSLSYVDSNNVQRWVEVYPDSDTTIQSKKSANAADRTIKLYIYGISSGHVYPGWT